MYADKGKSSRQYFDKSIQKKKQDDTRANKPFSASLRSFITPFRNDVTLPNNIALSIYASVYLLGVNERTVDEFYVTARTHRLKCTGGSSDLSFALIVCKRVPYFHTVSTGKPEWFACDLWLIYRIKSSWTKKETRYIYAEQKINNHYEK